MYGTKFPLIIVLNRNFSHRFWKTKLEHHLSPFNFHHITKNFVAYECPFDDLIDCKFYAST